MMRKLFFTFIGLFIGIGGQSSQPHLYQASGIRVGISSYAMHIEASKKFNIPVLENSKVINRYIRTGKLVSVPISGKGYRLHRLNYSQACLVPKAKAILQEMAKKFQVSTRGNVLTVTSLTRSLKDQCRLRKINSNAAIGISSHNYGNSFDISYIRFNRQLKPNLKLEVDLEKLLRSYKKAGKIYYIKERKQSCYHITVRNY
ncbi:DUF5715 family protein [Elizabethkingia argenteiflava]|nr:DUF5715 family protein [Elizabethkingia argenteiflava]